MAKKQSPLHNRLPRNTEGPLVCDLFVGNYPRWVSHIVVLNDRALRPELSEPDTLLLRAAHPVSPRPVQRPQPQKPLTGREEIFHELQSVLADDARRTRGLRATGHERRVSVHAPAPTAVTASPVPTPTRADNLHERARHTPLPAARPPQRLFRRHAVREAIRVGVGTLVFAGIVALAASAGTLPQTAERVQGVTRRGATALQSGVHSLLTADALAGQGSFIEAERAFREASQNLSSSITVAQRIVGAVDPAGRLSRAEALLQTGEQLARLGQEAAGIVGEFQHGTATLTDALEALSPKLETLERGLTDVRTQLAGLPLAQLSSDEAEEIQTVVRNVEFLDRAIENFLHSEEVVLELLGARQDRQYLMLFQNNRELRPTGGFIGSFGLVDVSRGRVKNIKVDTIYNPDGQLKDMILPPEPLRKITDRWYTRDANWFADFQASAGKIAHLFERSGGPTVDGVLAVTPSVLQDLLQLTGPIDMPEYGITVTADNVVQETQRLVTFEYDREKNEPKAFIADLLPEILDRVMRLPKERWGDVVETCIQALRAKHLLLAFRDEEAKKAVLALGWGGALPQIPLPQSNVFVDHVGRVEANIGGHKTDDLIEQSVEYDMTLDSENRATATLVVTRHHRGSRQGTPGSDPAEDPTRKPNIVYERTFAPHGSELLEARGFTRSTSVPSPFTADAFAQPLTADPDVEALDEHQREHPNGVVLGEESGFTTFEGWIITEPEETTVTVLRYRLPFRLPPASLLASIARYELLLTQQPGHLPTPFRATVRLPEGFRIAWSGPSSAVSEVGERKIRYEETLDRDLVWGAVIEEQ